MFRGFGFRVSCVEFSGSGITGYFSSASRGTNSLLTRGS